MGFSQKEAKKAWSGLLPLYRYNPDLADQGKNPFTLDSKPPKESFRDFLLGEVRYASSRSSTRRSRSAVQRAEEEAKAPWTTTPAGGAVSAPGFQRRSDERMA